LLVSALHERISGSRGEVEVNVPPILAKNHLHRKRAKAKVANELPRRSWVPTAHQKKPA